MLDLPRRGRDDHGHEGRRMGLRHRRRPVLSPTPSQLPARVSVVLSDQRPPPTIQPLAHRLALYQEEIRACTRCHADGLLHVDAIGGIARPVLARAPTAALGILVVGEAPNYADTYDAKKQYLTYEPGTDPTGSFMFELLVDTVGLTPAQVGDVLFANAIACLPADGPPSPCAPARPLSPLARPPHRRRRPAHRRFAWRETARSPARHRATQSPRPRRRHRRALV